jgi:outer membrane protein assembly factor BamB
VTRNACLLLALLLTGSGLRGTAQTTFHGNIAHTGVYESAGPKQLKGVNWAFKTGGPIFGSPAIAGGTVFIGSADGSLYAIIQETGQQKWKFDTEGKIASSPVVANGLVFFLSTDGFLYSLH